MLHPNETSPDLDAVTSQWRKGVDAEFTGDSWESIKALLRLRADY
jgi:hypothetical protein